MGQQVYAAVTPNDTNVIAPALIAVFVATSGTLVVRGKGDTNAAPSFSVPVGLFTFPYPVDIVKATGTSAVIAWGVAAA